jgi:hypothetical protein
MLTEATTRTGRRSPCRQGALRPILQTLTRRHRRTPRRKKTQDQETQEADQEEGEEGEEGGQQEGKEAAEGGGDKLESNMPSPGP